MDPVQVEKLVAAVDRAAARLTARPAMRDRDHMLREIVVAAMEAVPGSGHAGLTVLEADGTLTSTAPSSDVVAELDRAQARLGEGPCVAAVDPDTDPEDPGPASVVRVDDMEAEGGRWPCFAPAAVSCGIRSMLSLPLIGGRRQRIALNLYSGDVGAFDHTAQTIVRVFADQAAIALNGADQAASLSEAVSTRDLIGQAKGILMERHRVDGGAAFGMLVRASQETNTKLHDVARWLVADTAPDRAPSSASEVVRS